MEKGSKYRHQEQLGLDYMTYIQSLKDSWILLLACLVICLTSAWLYLRYEAVPSYYTHAKVLFADATQSNSSGGAGAQSPSDAFMLMGNRGSIENELEILQTRTLMEELVRNQRLNLIWYHIGTLREVEIFETPYVLEMTKTLESLQQDNFYFQQVSLSEFRFEKSKEDFEKGVLYQFNTPYIIGNLGQFSIKKAKPSDIDNNIYRIEINSIQNSAADLLSRLTVQQGNKQSSVIDLRLSSSSPPKGEYILEGFISEYIRQNIINKTKLAENTMAFIDERIQFVSAELEGIEGNIQNFMQGSGLANISEQSKLLLERSTESSKELAEIESRLLIVSGFVDKLNEDGTAEIISGSVIADDPGFNTLIASYNSLNLEREKLLLSYTPNNPYVLNANQQLSSIRTNILNYLRDMKRRLQTQRDMIEKDTRKLDYNIREVPAKERAYLDLSRQQQLKQELYIFLLQKREETAIANTSNLGNIRVIDKPLSNRWPHSPQTRVIWIMAFFIAFTIPILKVYLKEVTKSKVSERRDVEKRTSINIIAELSHYPKKDKTVEFKTSRSILAEQFRSLRTDLQFLLPSAHQKVIMTTSSISGEGKSFTSINLAKVCAISDKKVLLLEFDLRKPSISNYLKLKTQVGICNFIVNRDLTFEDIVIPLNEYGNLHFIPSGPIPPNPSELILNNRVEELFKYAKMNYDYIIVDSPPIGIVTDADLLSRFSDTILYIVRVNHSPLHFLSKLEKLYHSGKIPYVSIILNDIKNLEHSYYNYYSENTNTSKWWKSSKSKVYG
ncbi:GumC family protein [Anditalea andensis]|uniref:non-specific protein-tyrosine kinase n=1 Tax=Anditalea andensis TaxID=1048983 RepID=A0A074KQR6_9BACT|nr:tyrosine-protein kinase family protein [Anditalea andensis]KEO72291.1 hypothetical protein EL17_16200 [Anditalea andensis]